jgi:maltose O-acetyltransferase
MKKMKEILYSYLCRLRSEVSTQDLIKLGLGVGKNFSRQEKCIIDQSHCWLISIGDNVTLAPRVHILAHDASTYAYLGYTKIGIVEIGNNVFVGAGTIILPNVKIGDNVVIGAGSVVSRDIPNDVVVAGNPANIICSIEKYIDKNQYLMMKNPVYDESYTLRNKKITHNHKSKMYQELLKSKIGYVK